METERRKKDILAEVESILRKIALEVHLMKMNKQKIWEWASKGSELLEQFNKRGKNGI